MSDLRTRYKNLDMAISYNEVTEKYGPCIQLMEFMNFDKKLGEEIGLESFDSLSLLGQHEMLVATMNLPEMEEMAIESVDTAIDTFGRLLRGVGSAAAFGSAIVGRAGLDIRSSHEDNISWAKKVLLGLGISVAAALAGHLIVRANAKYHKHPIKYGHFEDLKRAFKKIVDFELSVASKIPNDFDFGKWEALANYVEHSTNQAEDLLPSYERMFEESQKTDGKLTAPFETSGWTAGNFSAALKWVDEEVKKLESARKKSLDHLDKIRTFVNTNKSSGDKEAKKVVREIGYAIEDMHNLFKHSDTMLGRLQHIVGTVAHYFEEKK